ncbi:GGDEF domain-containing protein [Miltoncostaea oceani]|uniref:GGDEF domain-containing protein n=1 Tax=Miltoncostaea oceani TaxID=2843216 RepID=UPI001C3E2163|nr:GGDEF domain-containing protein [Miltoncostaea oceani]
MSRPDPAEGTPIHRLLDDREGLPHADGAARRRHALLVVATLVPTVLILAGSVSAWPLYALPIALSLPLGGPRAMAAAGAVASLTVAYASGRPGADGAAMALGVAAFLVTGLAIGAGHRAQERDARRIANLSLIDRLTGVHNYAFFADALPRECRRAERYGLPLSLVVLDLDRFKAFNDRHGHDAGNRLLTAVGEAIRASSRASDIAARFGGEEFALIVPGPAEEALEAAERIRAAVSRVSVLVAGGESAGTTISAGVADFQNGDGDDGTRMLDQADKALYHSKASGRDRVSLFAPEHRWAAAS